MLFTSAATTFWSSVLLSSLFVDIIGTLGVVGVLVKWDEIGSFIVDVVNNEGFLDGTVVQELLEEDGVDEEDGMDEEDGVDCVAILLWCCKEKNILEHFHITHF